MKDMIDLFGGIRFRHMKLYNVHEMRLLLEACAETLETLSVYPTDPHGEQFCLDYAHVLANDLVARSSLRDFDLSRNKSLRTLGVQPSSFGSIGSPDAAPFLKYVLSMITSSMPTDLTVVYLAKDICGVELRHPGWSLLRELSQAEREREASWHRRQFEVLRDVRKVRDFRIVLSAMVWGCVGEYPVQVLEKAIAEEKAKGGFGDFSRQPLAVNHPSRVCPRC